MANAAVGVVSVDNPWVPFPENRSLAEKTITKFAQNVLSGRDVNVCWGQEIQAAKTKDPTFSFKLKAVKDALGIADGVKEIGPLKSRLTVLENVIRLIPSAAEKLVPDFHERADLDDSLTLHARKAIKQRLDVLLAPDQPTPGRGVEAASSSVPKEKEKAKDKKEKEKEKLSSGKRKRGELGGDAERRAGKGSDEEDWDVVLTRDREEAGLDKEKDDEEDTSESEAVKLSGNRLAAAGVRRFMQENGDDAEEVDELESARLAKHAKAKSSGRTRSAGVEGADVPETMSGRGPAPKRARHEEGVDAAGSGAAAERDDNIQDVSRKEAKRHKREQQRQDKQERRRLREEMRDVDTDFVEPKEEDVPVVGPQTKRRRAREPMSEEEEPASDLEDLDELQAAYLRQREAADEVFEPTAADRATEQDLITVVDNADDLPFKSRAKLEIGAFDDERLIVPRSIFSIVKKAEVDLIAWRQMRNLFSTSNYTNFSWKFLLKLVSLERDETRDFCSTDFLVIVGLLASCGLLKASQVKANSSITTSNTNAARGLAKFSGGNDEEKRHNVVEKIQAALLLTLLGAAKPASFSSTRFTGFLVKYSLAELVLSDAEKTALDALTKNLSVAELVAKISHSSPQLALSLRQDPRFQQFKIVCEGSYIQTERFCRHFPVLPILPLQITKRIVDSLLEPNDEECTLLAASSRALNECFERNLVTGDLGEALYLKAVLLDMWHDPTKYLNFGIFWEMDDGKYQADVPRCRSDPNLMKMRIKKAIFAMGPAIKSCATDKVAFPNCFSFRKHQVAKNSQESELVLSHMDKAVGSQDPDSVAKEWELRGPDL